MCVACGMRAGTGEGGECAKPMFVSNSFFRLHEFVDAIEEECKKDNDII